MCDVCAAQLLPPLLVCRIVPLSPTAHPWDQSRKVTPRSEAALPVLRAVQVSPPLAVQRTVPPSPTTQALLVSTTLTALRRAAAPDFCAFQVAPPSAVLSTKPRGLARRRGAVADRPTSAAEEPHRREPRVGGAERAASPVGAAVRAAVDDAVVHARGIGERADRPEGAGVGDRHAVQRGTVAEAVGLRRPASRRGLSGVTPRSRRRATRRPAPRRRAPPPRTPVQAESPNVAFPTSCLCDRAVSPLRP